MQDTSGYVADIGYTYGYYSELNPVAARFSLLAAGYDAPSQFDNACELGFGQGISLNMHAAASSTRWWGNDFIPQQAQFAQELSSAAGSSATISAESFEAFCHRGDLPDMDYIGLHGVWTWVSEENRRTILDFIRRKLKPGGVVYASYNTLPGWANMIPVREVFVDYANAVAGSAQSTAARIDAAVSFTERLLSVNPLFLRGNPAAQQQLRGSIDGRDTRYLAHEFFNADWEPMSFARVAKHLEQAGVSFVCPAHLLEHVNALFMTREQMALVEAMPDERLRQSVRDLCLNATFRRDYWMREPRRLSPAERQQALEQQAVVLGQPSQNVVLRVGEARLSEAIYEPILGALADFKPKTLGELGRIAAARNIGFDQLMQAIVVLLGKQDLQLVQPQTAQATDSAHRLNRHMMTLARRRSDLWYMASPVTGGGVLVPRFDQLYLEAMLEGEEGTDAWSRFAWKHLKENGEQILKDGRPAANDAEAVGVLAEFADDFARNRLAVYRALRVIA